MKLIDDEKDRRKILDKNPPEIKLKNSLSHNVITEKLKKSNTSTGNKIDLFKEENKPIEVSNKTQTKVEKAQDDPVLLVFEGFTLYVLVQLIYK